VSLSDVVTLVAAAFGAFFGSGLAFLLEERRRRRVEADRRYSRLLEAQLALGMQLETLLNVQRRYLDPHRNEPDRHMQLEPLHMSMTDLRVDFSALVFIAEVDGFDILQKVYLAEQGYITATTALAESNSKIEKRPSDGAITSGSVDPEAGAAVAVFDSAAAANLKEFIDDLYRSVDEDIDSVQGAIGELTSATRRLYPKRKSHHFILPAEDLKNPG
jgi:hypothetical protein